MGLRRFQGQTVGVRVPTGRMDDRRVDAAFAHLLEQVIGCEIGYLPVARITRHMAFPKMHLGVYDQNLFAPKISYFQS